MEIRQLTFGRNGGETRRYHTWPVLRQQTVAEHSCHVALIVAWLAGHRAPGVSVPLLMAALTHDLAEHKMGDVPAPVKRSLPNYPDQSFRQAWDKLEQGHLETAGLDWEHMLNDEEKRWLKLADAADGCFYCVRERAMGNRLINEVYANFRRYMGDLITFDVAEEQQLMDYIDAEWENACGG